MRFLAILLVSACAADSADPDAMPTPTPTPSCAASWDPNAVVACDFAPGTRPFAAADGVVYVVSGVSTYSAIRVGDATTRLYHDLSLDGTSTRALETVLHGDRLLFPGLIPVGPGEMPGLVSISADRATPDGAPKAVQYDEPYEPIAPLVGDDSHIYAASIGSQVSAVGPVIAISYDGATQTAVTSDAGAPIDVVDGVLWYRPDVADHAVKRLVLGDDPASAQTVATDLAWAPGDRAVDRDAVYAITAAAPYEIRRFGADGTNELVVTASMGDAEIQLGPPHDLRLDGNTLYYLQGDGYAWLTRVPLDGSAPDRFFAQQDLTPPVFDDDAIYVGYTRGGSDEPIEGVVARVPKTSTAAAGSSK